MASDANDESKLPTVPEPVGEGIEIDPIRTETIFSRMPLHVLSKSGPRPQINIEKRSADGKVTERWEVTYNEKYGPARQLAYDLHTLVIERAIEEAFDEARRTNQPFPRLIPLSSLNDVANHLGPNSETRNTNRIKKALSQNAGILITALKRYRGSDGIEYTLEGIFTPYGIFFFGQKLPSGARADQVYINLNDAYFEAWSRSSSRPLDYNYKAQLPPIPRRFYELVSYAIYGAIKNGQPTARYRYSEFCKNAPQLRYDIFDQVKKQMYKIHRPHVEQGYIVKVKYEETIDETGKPDWWMVYVPGPRAYTEFAIFTGKHPRPLDSATVHRLPAGESAAPTRRPRQRHLKLAPAPIPKQPPVIIDYTTVQELEKRGVSGTDARKLLATLPPGQPVLDQLEYGDLQIEQSRGKIMNPPGFYISLLQRNIPVPATFESARTRKARQEAILAQQQALQQQVEEAKSREEADRLFWESQIAALPAEQQQGLFDQAKAELLTQFPNMAQLFKTHPDSVLNDGAVRARMRRLFSEGWKHNQAINQTIRQADPLKDSAPVNTQTEAQEPHFARGEFAIALQALLSTPQLPEPVKDVEQGSVEPTPAGTPPEKSSIDPHQH